MSEVARSTWTRDNKTSGALTKSQKARAGLTGVRNGLDGILNAWEAP